MITPELIVNSQVSFSQLYSNHVEAFLEAFKNKVRIDDDGMELTFDIAERKKRNKINPVLKIAKPKDAETIIKICNEAYEGTYPYLEMLDPEVLKHKIKSGNYVFFLFKDTNDDTLGTFKFYLDFDNKKGYLGGFCVRKAYQSKIDSLKCQIGMLLWMVSQYGKDVLVWYCENRTAHAATQYMVHVCGMRPVGFYPNKDIFFNEVESDLLQIVYDEKALRELRRTDPPELIREVMDCFIYSDQRYDLGTIRPRSPVLNLDPVKLAECYGNLIRLDERDQYGYREITLKMIGSDSYFSFLHTSTVKNLEKTEYKVNSLEELFVFAQAFKKIARELQVRYIEVFVSAHEAEHQQVFSDAGLIPRGYVPSWKYDKEQEWFEDYILFSHHEGELCERLELIDEAWELLEYVKV